MGDVFGFMQEVPANLFDVADPVLRELELCRFQANMAAARLAHCAWDLWAERLSAACDDPDADAATVAQSAVAEVAVALGCSQATALAMVDTAQMLSRLPAVDRAFGNGCLDYAKARTIAAVLDDASDATLAAIEDEVLALAGQYTPGPLRAAIWRTWLRVAPEEAAAVRALARRTDRKVYVRSGADGMAWLSACLTDLEGAEAAALIDELADSVCAHDPRGRDHRRADALLALLHGESFLRCGCEDPTCARAGTAPPARRAHLLQILVDIETLLGIGADPATLPDGTPLDAELVRILATDATWQGLLTEMRNLADTMRATNQTPGEVDSEPDDHEPDGHEPDDHELDEVKRMLARHGLLEQAATA
jgi:hypothetical protein